MFSRFSTIILLAFFAGAARAEVVSSLDGKQGKLIRAAVVDDRSAPAIYQSAGEAYEAGDFPKAISLYEQIVHARLGSESLFLNLGTAHFRNGSPGKAVLWFRRAAMLSPGMPELKQNFTFLRQQLGFLEFGDSTWKRSLLAISPFLLRSVAWLLLWLGLFGLLWSFVFANKKGKAAGVPVASFLLLGAAACFSLNHYRSSRLAPENFATVVIAKTSALVAPAPDSPSVIDLPEGSELRILQDTGPWVYALMPGDLVGWVHHTSIEKNWPIPEPETTRIGLARDSVSKDTVVLSR